MPTETIAEVRNPLHETENDYEAPAQVEEAPTKAHTTLDDKISKLEVELSESETEAPAKEAQAQANTFESAISKLEAALNAKEGQQEKIVQKSDPAAAVSEPETASLRSGEDPEIEEDEKVKEERLRSPKKEEKSEKPEGLLEMLKKLIKGLVQMFFDTIDNVVDGVFAPGKPSSSKRNSGSSDIGDEGLGSKQLQAQVKREESPLIEEGKPSEVQKTGGLKDSQKVESDETKKLKESFGSLIDSCKGDEKKTAIMRKFLDEGGADLEAEESNKFDAFKEIAEIGLGIRKAVTSDQPATQDELVELLDEEREGEEGQKKGKEGQEKGEEGQEKGAPSLDAIMPGASEKVVEKEVLSKSGEKKEDGLGLGEIPGVREAVSSIAAGGATRSDRGNSSPALAPTAISNPGASKEKGRD